MKKITTAILTGSTVILLLSGCSMKNDFNVVLPKDYKVKQLNYNLSKVNVQIASEKEKTGELDIFTTTFPGSFEDSLTKALNETKIFNNKSGNNIDIKVLVLKNDAPSMGFTMTVDTDVLYIIRSHAGKVIYNKTISAKGIATPSEKFSGVERMTLANDRAIQNNIKLFIDDVQASLKNSK